MAERTKVSELEEKVEIVKTIAELPSEKLEELGNKIYISAKEFYRVKPTRLSVHDIADSIRYYGFLKTIETQIPPNSLEAEAIKNEKEKTFREIIEGIHSLGSEELKILSGAVRKFNRFEVEEKEKKENDWIERAIRDFEACY
jgi:hypothetical protein